MRGRRRERMQPMLVPLSRAAASLGLGAFAVYMGASLQRAPGDTTQVALLMALALAIVLAGVWSVLWLPGSRVAAGAAAIITGVAPIATFVGWQAVGGADFAMMAILWGNLVTGILALLFTSWVLLRGSADDRRRAARAMRV